MLRLLAVAVAFIGVLSALMALELERARELGVLRANGLTPGQVWGLVTAQTGLMGLVAGVLAVPVGLVLAPLRETVLDGRRSTATGYYGFVVEFAELVRGPIAVGYGTHFGLGTFTPAQATLSTPSLRSSTS